MTYKNALQRLIKSVAVLVKATPPRPPPSSLQLHLSPQSPSSSSSSMPHPQYLQQSPPATQVKADKFKIRAQEVILAKIWELLEQKTPQSMAAAKIVEDTNTTEHDVAVGDVGYAFLKYFLNDNDEWQLYLGKVTQIFLDGDRRCVYEDGDKEDLSLNDLYQIAESNGCSSSVRSSTNNISRYGSAIIYGHNNKSTSAELEVKKITEIQTIEKSMNDKFINNSNLQKVWDVNHCPLIALNRRGEKTMLGIMGYMSAKYTIVLPVWYHQGKMYRSGAGIIHLNGMSGYTIKYLNNIGTLPFEEGTDLGCDTRGPDMFRIESLPNDFREAIDQAKNDFRNQLVTNKQSSNEPTQVKQLIPSVNNHSKNYKTLSRTGKKIKEVTPLKEIKRGKEDRDKLFSVRYMNKIPSKEGNVCIAYISYASYKRVYNKGIGVKKMMSREDFDSELKLVSVVDAEIEVSNVSNPGLAFVEADSSKDIGTTTNDTEPIEAYERNRVTFAEWILHDNVDIDLNTLRELLYKTYKSHKFSRSCAGVIGLNLYKGICNAAYVRATPGKRKIDVCNSQYHRAAFDDTHIPIINNAIDKLTSHALNVRRMYDPVYEKFQRDVAELARQEVSAASGPPRKKRRVIRQANELNGLQLATHNFAIGSHFDIHDIHDSDTFRYYASIVLDKYIKKASELLSRNETKKEGDEYMQLVCHILRLGQLDDTKHLDWSLYTACGYAAEYTGKKNVSAMFIYDSIDSGVNIPLNKISYQIFNGVFTKHHTSIPFVYDDENVFLNDNELNIFAWGGGSSDKKDYITTNLPHVEIRQRVTDTYFAQLINQQGARAVDRARAHFRGNNSILQYLRSRHDNV